MSTKHTVISDHKIENFRDNLRIFLFHAKICQTMAHIMAKSPLHGIELVDRGIKPEVQRVASILSNFECKVNDTMREPLSKTEQAILDHVNTNLDPDGDKVNNIAEITLRIADSQKDYTDMISLAFNRQVQKDILRKYWMAGARANGSMEEFELHHDRNREIVLR